jgi:Putative Actinobacterial Holin-X, holin superfamily III
MSQPHYEHRLHDERPLSRLLEDTLTNTQELIRSEFRLATTEVQEKLAVARKPATIFAAGIIAALYGLGFLLLSAVYGLSIVVPPWLAALIVGAALLGTAAFLMSSGRGRLRQVRPPEKTIQSVKENITWLKDQMR